MNSLILLLLGLLLAIYTVWPSPWIAGVAAVFVICLGLFKVMVAR